jgi:hypothetical protein
MDYRTVFPTFPRPPREYDQRYFDDLTRALDALVVAIRNPGEGRQTTVVMTNLQTTDYALEPGTLFQQNGVVYVTLLYTSHVGGLSATGSVGTVAVTV